MSFRGKKNYIEMSMLRSLTQNKPYSRMNSTSVENYTGILLYI